MKKPVIALASALALTTTTLSVPVGPAAALFGPIAPALASPDVVTAADLGASSLMSAKQLAEVKGNTGAVDFGQALAISGSTLVVGAPYNSWAGQADVGLVYVFTKTAPGWHQTAELQGPVGFGHEAFGQSVAISGSTVVVGAPGYASHAGRAYVFTETSAGWHLGAQLEGSDTVAHDGFGAAVAVSGNTIAVGSGTKTDGGRAYVFANSSGSWRQTAELKGSNTVPDDGFGDAVAISGETVVVGALFHADLSGAIYVFSNGARGWRQAAVLKGALANTYFGESVAMSGNIIVVGATGSPSGTGWAYVVTGTASGWHKTAALANSDAAPHDYFGQSVAISGSTIAVGASLQSGGGRAYTFTKTATGWREAAELRSSDAIRYDWFGDSLAVSGTDVFVGAPYYSGTGRAYVFET